jgi:hypothetical protein
MPQSYDTIIGQAPIYNIITPTSGSMVLFKDVNGQFGYATAKNFITELDRDGLASDLQLKNAVALSIAMAY